ncbi:DUF4397 domain-containing protein [Pedobacter punctiformis]|uniref:DUF4397 domain-containing protein n=1 Tax=Pedobacter punctiformis TaxID=3004097 RepID=A0ABT4LAT5_9SPHI|nr:DUF4397 domain-containing protein [Pedobacter sp. HCMS5-2]MCZ4245023.1 DUF4397 domain-containing protein [Pedobacter sp. HCMS5-2]
MKTNLNNYFGITSKIIFSLFAVTLFFSSCKKDWNNSDPIEAAGIGFVHASPGAGALDFIVDNSRVNNKIFTYTNDMGYFAAYPGSRLIGVTKKDSLKYLTTTTATFKSGKFYSIFVIDTLKKNSILVLEDDLTAPETDKAKIRFVNLSPDAPALDLAIQGQPALFATKAYKEFTSFVAVAPSDNYTFEVKESANPGAKTTLEAVKIEKGKIYTIWAKGLKSKTDSTKFGLKVMSNN